MKTWFDSCDLQEHGLRKYGQETEIIDFCAEIVSPKCENLFASKTCKLECCVQTHKQHETEDWKVLELSCSAQQPLLPQQGNIHNTPYNVKCIEMVACIQVRPWKAAYSIFHPYT